MLTSNRSSISLCWLYGQTESNNSLHQEGLICKILIQLVPSCFKTEIRNGLPKLIHILTDTDIMKLNLIHIYMKNLKSWFTYLITVYQKNRIMDHNTVVSKEHKRHRRHFGQILRTVLGKNTPIMA